MSDDDASVASDPRGAELARAVAIVADMTEDAEARRDTAFACLAELLRLSRADLAEAMARALRDRLQADPETAVLPPDPPPGLSPGTHRAFDEERNWPVWPWSGPDLARQVRCAPDICAGIGAAQWRDGKCDGWEWAEIGAAHANRPHPAQRHRPRCEPLGTFLAWLVAARHRVLGYSTIPRELRQVWPWSYPEARRFCRPGPDGATPEDTTRAAAAMIAEAEQRLRERSAGLDREVTSAGTPRPTTS